MLTVVIHTSSIHMISYFFGIFVSIVFIIVHIVPIVLYVSIVVRASMMIWMYGRFIVFALLIIGMCSAGDHCRTVTIRSSITSVTDGDSSSDWIMMERFVVATSTETARDIVFFRRRTSSLWLHCNYSCIPWCIVSIDYIIVVMKEQKQIVTAAADGW